MTIEIWLSHKEGGTNKKFMIPVNPSTLSIKQESNNEIISIQRLGDIPLLKYPKLKEVTFSSFFPARRGPYVKLPSNQNLWSPHKYVSTINKWRKGYSPSRLIITSSGNVKSALELNMAVTIEEFEVYENAGEVGDAYYNITLKQFKSVSIKKTKTKTKNGEKKTTVSKKTKRDDKKGNVSNKGAKSYTVVSGDNLWTIAKKHDMSWKDIATKNNIKAPWTIQPKQVLKL